MAAERWQNVLHGRVGLNVAHTATCPLDKCGNVDCVGLRDHGAVELMAFVLICKLCSNLNSGHLTKNRFGEPQIFLVDFKGFLLAIRVVVTVF